MTVDWTEDKITISWKLPKDSGWVFIFLGILVCACFITIGFAPGRYGEPRTATDGVIGIVLALVTGIPCLYLGLVFLLNKGCISADRKYLECTFGPLPFRKSVSVPAGSLLQFYIGGTPSSSSASILHYLDQEQVSHKLTALLPSRLGAFQICHELQDYFGLEDEEIYGVTKAPHHPGVRP